MLVLSTWLNIALILFVNVYGPSLLLGPET